ncbi:MAG TPA: T9SS type A sorting domain-containing protein [Bacteroidales bacterium]|nr:T9SS type A sorting domain-containing protein [Bacteroidales bacterium]HSA42204.1 T9SS type A sorting domain-containing protein [Bacteroidales bacterium]
MKKIVSILSIVLFATLSGKSQSISLSSVYGAIPGSDVTVFAVFSNYYNPGAFSFEITYDHSVLEYKNYDCFIVFTNGYANVTNTVLPDPPGTFSRLEVMLCTFSSSTFIHDTIFAFHFTYLGGFSNLTLTPDPGCTMLNGSVSGYSAGLSDGSGAKRGMMVYPNPVTGDQIRIQVPEAGNFSVRLYASNGSLILDENIVSQSGTIRITRDKVPKGLYLLRVSDGKKPLCHPVMLQ